MLVNSRCELRKGGAVELYQADSRVQARAHTLVLQLISPSSFLLERCGLRERGNQNRVFLAVSGSLRQGPGEGSSKPNVVVSTMGGVTHRQGAGTRMR